jgi:hypothetical protein
MRVSGLVSCVVEPVGSALPLPMCLLGEHAAELDASSALAGGRRASEAARQPHPAQSSAGLAAGCAAAVCMLG